MNKLRVGRFICNDCKQSPYPLFIVHDELWLSVAVKEEILCIDCFESRLGREVLWADLKMCGCTETMELGAKIWNRSFK